MTRTTTTMAAALALALAACGDATGTAGSGEATMQVAAQGDADGASQSAAAAPGGAPAFAQAAGSAEGTVTFRARVWAQSSAGTWVELTRGAAQQAAVDASGRAGSVVFATADVEAETYTRVRVVFEEVRANVSGGVTLSAGGILSGEARVDLAGDGSVTVERAVSVSAASGSTARVLVDLNADAWLNRASATTRTVSEAEFASAVRITGQ